MHADEHKQTPLHYAAKSGCTDIVKALVNAKADLNVASSEGQTPLHYAARSGSIDAMTILLNANVELNVANTEGWTPLHYAAHYGRIDLVSPLVEAKADLSVTGEPPLNYELQRWSIRKSRCLWADTTSLCYRGGI
ncbi:ankyrin repeat-containing domain protein [Flagelloscypha sp. PMI_526]|nr:ankyrin repeat-containing domain protein [Flagelloscypha sp. PMI_526]